MLIYCSVAMALLIFSFIFGFNPRLRTLGKHFATCLIALTGLFSLWRMAGTDYALYSGHFALLSTSLDNLFDANGGSWEKGFVILAGIFSTFGLPYNALMVSSIWISLIACFYVARRVTPNVTAFAFALFCLCFLFIPFVRQDLASGLCFLAFFFAIRDRMVWFLVASAAAIAVHLSAGLVLVPVFFIVDWQKNGLRGGSMFKAVAAFAFLACLAAYFLVDPGRIADQVSAYGAEGFVQGVVDEQTSAIRNSFKFVFYAFFALTFGYCYRHIIKENIIFVASVWIVVSFSILSIVLSQLTPVFSRLSTYLFPFVALMYAETLRGTRLEHLRFNVVSSVFLIGNFVVAFVPLADWM